MSPMTPAELWQHIRWMAEWWDAMRGPRSRYEPEPEGDES